MGTEAIWNDPTKQEEIPVPRLQKWINEHLPKPEMYWHQAFLGQVMFVRDYLSEIFAENYKEFRDAFDVSGVHRSKSIDLPVYRLTTKQGLVMEFRNNFYDWNLSVSSPRPLECGDFLGVLSQKQLTGTDYCFFQGMTMQYRSYSENKQQFSLYCNSNYELYTIFRVIKDALGRT